MSPAADLSIKYADALRGFGASLPDDFAAGAAGVEQHLTEEQLERWAAAGIALTRHSLRSWEAAAEYFRASPRMVRLAGFDDVMRWVQLGTELSDRSSLMAAAFLKAAPDVMGRIPADQLEAWAQQGERLCRGNWKSIALSSLYFSSSARLLDSFSLPSLDRLVDVVEVLTERSYELATTCLESSGDIFAALAVEDREPFLAFARAVTRASWADTRLYFERGPKLIEAIDPAQRATFLDLAARVTTEVGRQGFPLFSEAAQAVGEIPPESHAVMLGFAGRLADGSPTAAMEYLKSAPFIATRLTPEQMEQWAAAGLEILEMEHNAEGAEAFFRFESTRAEEMLAALSARIELSAVGGTLRLYAKALTGEQVSVLSSDELVDRGIGWVSEGTATTEGTSIYLPPYVNTFPEQKSNFQVYKVSTTHQTGRMEFGSFRYVFGPDGAYTTSTAASREAARAAAAADATAAAEEGDGGDEVVAQAVSTEIQRYFNLFPDRLLISALFTVVEDTRIDACVAREYGGIRTWLRRLQAYEAGRRPDVRAMGLRQAFIENLLRASLGRTETILWPEQFQDQLLTALAALKVVEQDDATVQDSAEVAASLYDIAITIRNVAESMIEGDWVGPDEEMISVGPMMPGGEGEGGESQLMPNSEEIAFETPPQPEFRGDFKPELVQLMIKLKLQQEGQQDGVSAPLTKEQLMELLENSVEVTISDWAEGDLASSLGMFLDNLEKEGGTPAGDPKNKKEGEGGEEGDTPGPGDDEGELEVKIEWSYYDEWDFRANDYRPRWTRVGERPGELGELDFYEDTLQRHHGLVMETRRQFELMRPESFRKIKRLEDGHDIDLDQAVEFYIDKKAGVGPLARFYTRRNKVERDVAVAFLLDMSASTDEEIEKQRQKYDESDDEDFNDDPRKYFQWLAQRRARQAVEPPKRIIDLEKESSVLIVEALEAIGDAYGIYGFSGYGRENVEFHVIKGLNDKFDDTVRRRIDKIEPIRSTRMGPAIRHTITKLNEYDAKVKILILVSDGRPQDHGYGRDRTEKEYAVHDTKQALNEAKRDGITPFLITVDKEGHDYLKQMCDDIGYEVVSDIESLPRRLPALYKALAD